MKKKICEYQREIDRKAHRERLEEQMRIEQEIKEAKNWKDPLSEKLSGTDRAKMKTESRKERKKATLIKLEQEYSEILDKK